MGQRLSFNAADLIGNPNVQVKFYSEKLDRLDDENPNEPDKYLALADVRLVRLDIIRSMSFEVEVHDGVIELSCDHNVWGSAFMDRCEFLAALGVRYSVY
jgi:hypothetical protein